MSTISHIWKPKFNGIVYLCLSMERKHKTIIRPSRGIPGLRIRELLEYRDLFSLLAYRDYRIRYAQTFLGLTWAIIQPLLTLTIFVVVFGKAIKVNTGPTPYPLYAMCGMTAWTYFSFLMGQSGNSVINAQNIIQKIYFPRLIIPLSKAVVGLVDFSVTLVFLVGLMVYYGVKPGPYFIFFPILFLLTVMAGLGMGLWISALTIRYRDFQHVVPFMVQIGMWVTPVAYSSGLIIHKLPAWCAYLYYLNPAAGLCEAYRWSILGASTMNNLVFLSFATTILLFVTGLFYFKKTEKLMADLV